MFKVLEEMKSRQMYGLAEMVVAYVGTGEAEEDDYSEKEDDDSEDDLDYDSDDFFDDESGNDTDDDA